VPKLSSNDNFTRFVGKLWSNCPLECREQWKKELYGEGDKAGGEGGGAGEQKKQEEAAEEEEELFAEAEDGKHKQASLFQILHSCRYR